MTTGEMRHVKYWRPIWRACVEHLEHRLKVSVQINYRCDNSSQHELFITVIPPPMYASFWKMTGITGFHHKSVTINQSGQSAWNHFYILILFKVNMERRSLPMSGQRAGQVQLLNTVIRLNTAHREPLSDVSEHQRHGLTIGLFHIVSAW